MHVVNKVPGSDPTLETIGNMTRIRIPHLKKPLGSKTGTFSVLAIGIDCSVCLLDYIGDNPFNPAAFNMLGLQRGGQRQIQLWTEHPTERIHYHSQQFF